MKSFTIYANEYLNKTITGYSNRVYYGMNQPNNPDFLNHLKNTYNKSNQFEIQKMTSAKNEVINILLEDIPQIIQTENMNNCICVCVPRSKSYFTQHQQYFRSAVGEACKMINGLENGCMVIQRVVDTFTTHLSRCQNIENNGEKPYIGITKDTCTIDAAKIKGKDVILIDDIYTHDCNIDEDCIQTLLDIGARRVIFYSVAHTGSF